MNSVAREAKTSAVSGSQSATKSRVSRSEAVQRFLDVTIELLDSRPIADVSLQEIADTARLNHGYVFRYFGTRLDLFTAVSDELARLSSEAATAEILRRRETGEVFGPIDQSALTASWTYAIARMKVVNYLVSIGANPKRFAEKSREFTSRIEDQLREVGINARMSRALAVRAGVLLWSQVSLIDLLGVTDSERDDVLALNLDQFTNHRATAKRLGWT